jgi:hypothetical protein
VDWLGAVLLIGAVTPILVALSLGGSPDFPWSAPQTIGLFVVGGVLLLAFIVVELLVKEPILPLDLFKNRIFAFSVLTMALVGIGMFGAIINLPFFIQGVQGYSATVSGNTITPMMLSLIVVSAVSGWILSRTGRYRILGVVGTLALAGGMFLLSTMTVATQYWQTLAYMIVIGFGLGIAMPIYTVIVQNAVPVERLGVVTSATTFFRSIGGTVGIAVLGGVVNNRFASEYSAGLNASTQVPDQMKQALLNNPNLSPQSLISPSTIAAIQQQLQATGLPVAQVNAILSGIEAPIKPALSAAITEAFFIGAIVVAAAIIATALIPEIPLRRSNVRAASVEAGEFAVGVDETAEAEEAPTLPVPAPVPAGARVGLSRVAAVASTAHADGAQRQPAADGAMSELTWAALGLTLGALAREAQSPDADPRLLVALSDAVDGRYPHSWSAEERGRAVAREMVEPLATALLSSYVAGADTGAVYSAALADLASGANGNGYSNGYSDSTGSNGRRAAGNGAVSPPTDGAARDLEPSRPMKRVRVTRRLVVDGQVVGERVAEDTVPLEADTEMAAALLRAQMDEMEDWPDEWREEPTAPPIGAR